MSESESNRHFIPFSHGTDAHRKRFRFTPHTTGHRDDVVVPHDQSVNARSKSQGRHTKHNRAQHNRGDGPFTFFYCPAARLKVSDGGPGSGLGLGLSIVPTPVCH